jgi:hypothetical protein
VVYEFANRNPGGDFGHPSKMIAVPVCGDQMIDLAQTCILCGIRDAARIAACCPARIPRIDEDRLAGRRDKQGCVSTLDVDDVDVQSAWCSRLSGIILCDKNHDCESEHK